MEALNASPCYVSYMCKRLDINEEVVKKDPTARVAEPTIGTGEQSDEPVVGALKFLLIPLIMKENIRPKVYCL